MEFVFHQSSTCLTFRKECTHEKFFSTLLVLTLVFACFATAVAETGVMYNDSSIVTCANPDNNRDDPYDLSDSNYTSVFAFKESSTTMAIKVPADGDATVTLTNAYMNFDSTNKPTVYVKAYYWNGTTWKRATVTPSSVKVSKNMATYTFNVTGISRGTAFYVKLSKTEYTGYKFTGNITISD